MATGLNKVFICALPLLKAEVKKWSSELAKRPPINFCLSSQKLGFRSFNLPLRAGYLGLILTSGQRKLPSLSRLLVVYQSSSYWIDSELNKGANWTPEVDLHSYLRP